MRRTFSQQVIALSRRMGTLLLALWPAAVTDWGNACVAELFVIESPAASLRWLCGGLMLFVREWVKHFFRGFARPLGVSSGGPLESLLQKSRGVPRFPRWVTLALLFASAAILLHPEVRCALSKISAPDNFADGKSSLLSDVARLRKLSETNPDPQLLAFLSLFSEDQERLRLSETAIQRNPQLTWLDYEISWDPALPRERIERLQKWDPENALPHLLLAESLRPPLRSDAFDVTVNGRRQPSWERAAVSDPRWLAAMQAAFSAPHYDNYRSRKMQLIVDICRQFHITDPDLGLRLIIRERVVPFDLIQAYQHLLFDRAAQSEARSDWNSAAADYWQLYRFAQKMTLPRQLPVDRLIAARLGSATTAKLLPILERTGQQTASSLAAAQLSQWQDQLDPRIFRNYPVRYASWDAWFGSAVQIHLTGWFTLALWPLSLVSFLAVLLLSRRSPERRGIADSFFAIFSDLGPLLLLLSSAALFLAYHPDASVCARYLAGAPFANDPEEFVNAALVMHLSPFAQLHFDLPYYFWASTTIVLTFLAILFSYRLIFRQPPASRPAA